jgi:hypothetical protein
MTKHKVTQKKVKCPPGGGGGGGVARRLSDAVDQVRQSMYPPEWRIELLPGPERGSGPVGTPVSQETVMAAAEGKALAEMATCLWYVKTRHFKCDWKSLEATDDDPRTRRTLGRLEKGVDALRQLGISVEDPTGQRYPTGGEALMKPLDFIPQDGMAVETVVETVRPIVYWRDRLVQRAEVFVGVPPAAGPSTAPPEGSGDPLEQPTRRAATPSTAAEEQP